MGTLLREKHPASGVLKRARNSLGFHWDYEDKFLGPIIGEFAKNEMIIWVEEVPSPKRDTVHRLASEVLAHAVLPEVSLQSDPSEQFKSGKSAIADVIDAMNIIAEYFTAVVVAYLREQGVTTVVAA